jgi:hypothetical protein
MKPPPPPAFELKYAPPGETIRAFMKSDAWVRGIRGPVGSAKSSACAIEIFRRALGQAKDRLGVRRTKAVIIRNTGPELKTTTIKTWLDWLPERVFGKFNWSPPYGHHIRKGEIDLEVLFLALDSADDQRKLLSLECTFAWVNEAREIEKGVIDTLTGRVGRFPSMKDGGATWSGIIMDTNAMSQDHWWPMLAGEVPVPEDMDPFEAEQLVRPPGWAFFVQPPGMLERHDGRGEFLGYEDNPAAENRANLPAEYYSRMVSGKTRSWVNVYVMNKLGSTTEGRTVYPSFRDDKHVATKKLQPVPGLPLLVGVDFGLMPAAIIGQRLRGRFLILKEVVAVQMGAARFAPHLKAILAEMLAGMGRRPGPEGAGSDPGVALWGDPAGDHRAETDETTPFQIFRAAGLPIVPAPSNDFVMRTEAVTLLLERMVDGEPAILLDPACMVLRAGFARGYAYPKVAASGGTRYADRPAKDRYSHPHDALQYLVLGAGVGHMLITRPGPAAKPVVAPREGNIFMRRSAAAQRQAARRSL